MFTRRCTILTLAMTAVALLLAVQAVRAAQPVTGFRVPEGFEISLYAGDDLAHDVYSMAVDAQGRVVVAGQGYVKVLHDDDGDGVADRATLFADFPKQGARGMVFAGPDLICTGDSGLWRLTDANGDLQADGRTKLADLKQRGDHSSNGVVRGPDGWYYVICGNDAGITAKHATTPGSPVRQPRQGALVRVSPDGKQSEVVADGFRNPYDLDFNAFGAALTVDADGERDQYMPWYSPTRLFDVALGMHHGWMLPGWIRSWNRPAYFTDNVPRLVEIGRGSPTGVLVYRHRQFPDAYRGGAFSCCWSLGCVYHFPLQRHGASYRGKRTVFMESTGEVGFAPVDLAVGPAGEMYVAIGGRGTRGSVFRVRYMGDGEETAGEPAGALDRVLRADQPLASWSRARWVPLARELGAEALEKAMLDAKRSVEERVRAVEVLVELFDRPSMAAAQAIAAGNEPALIARVAWALSRKPTAPATPAFLAELTHRDDPAVDRAAWEALAALPKLTDDVLAADWSDMGAAGDRRVRAAASLAAARLPEPLFQQVARRNKSPAQRLALAWCDSIRRKATREHFALALDVFGGTDDPRLRLDAVRLMQRSLGDIRVEPTVPDVYAGYTANDLERVSREQRQRAAAPLAAALPSGAAALDRELARLLGMLRFEHAGLPEAFAAQWSADSSVESDIHFLIALSRIPGERSENVSRQTAAALAGLEHKMLAGELSASRFWPQRVGEAFEQLCRRDPRLAEALLADDAFGLPGHSMFAARLPAESKRRAVRTIVARIDEDDAEAWTAELVGLTAALTADEARPALRRVWDAGALRDAVIARLTADPQPNDRPRFVETLRSGGPEAVEAAAGALAALSDKPTVDELAVALRCLKQFDDDARYASVAKSLAELLQTWTGAAFEPTKGTAGRPALRHPPWFRWFRKTYPDQIATLTGGDGDAESWLARLAAIESVAGDPERGRTVFARRSCARCHTGNSRLGPELNGVGARFAPRDLLLAIIDPNRDVSPAYRVTQVITSGGKVHFGQVIYESPEATLIQTGPDTTVRVPGSEITSMHKSPLSPMPKGLLREADDQETADLLAYLKTLVKR